jgi:hypothetical protein
METLKLDYRLSHTGVGQFEEHKYYHFYLHRTLKSSDSYTLTLHRHSLKNQNM